ncbi:hypothetical protein GGF32_008627 [Allomyces javanicus]|nr:hypothetical protein GGF32_008627 [Allomyces javanicus]
MPSTSSRSALAPVTTLALRDAWFLAVALVFGGCCSNAYFLERLVRIESSSTHLLTFAQFAFVSAVNLPRFLEPRPSTPSDPWWRPSWQLRPPVIPYAKWMVIVVAFTLVNVMNNLALAYKVPMPVHIVFRSGSLMVTMAINVLVARRRYPLRAVMAVFFVSVGVMLTVIMAQPRSTTASSATSVSHYTIGILLMSGALVLSGFMGLYQERIYHEYGRHWEEGLFYSHALALPIFLVLAPSISREITVFNASPPSVIPWIPSLWLLLAFNTATQYLCISAVHQLTSLASSLTTNLILTIRKLVSLLLSMLSFGTPLTVQTLGGPVLVAVGTYMYATAPGPATITKEKVEPPVAPTSDENTTASPPRRRSVRLREAARAKAAEKRAASPPENENVLKSGRPH